LVQQHNRRAARRLLRIFRNHIARFAQRSVARRSAAALRFIQR
jgi:hypothetical protein